MVHHERRVGCHVERGRKPDRCVDLLRDRFRAGLVLKTLGARLPQNQSPSNIRAYLELKAEHGRQLVNAQTLDRFVRLGTFTATILFRGEFFRLGEPETRCDQHTSPHMTSIYAPPQTSRQRILPSTHLSTLAPQLQTDIQHGIDRARRVPTPLTCHIALQLPRKRLVDDTIARRMRRAAARPMNLVEGGDEKLVGVLLRVTRHFRRDFPRRGEERCRSEWRLI